MNYSEIINCSIVDGTGFRVALYVSGCRHECEGCHNKLTWDFNAGKKYTAEVEDILFDRIDKPFIKGLTLTGGDPLYSAEEILGILKRFRERFGSSKDVWLYTGFMLDETLAMEDDTVREIVSMCDYIVDGRFSISEHNPRLMFRGSSNQTIWKNDGNGDFTHSEMNNDTKA